MSAFDDLLKKPLPSQDDDNPFASLFESGEDDDNEDEKENNSSEEKEEETDRQEIIDKIDEALDDLDGKGLTKDDTKDFLSGDESSINLNSEDLDVESDELLSAIKKIFKKNDDIEVEEEDGTVTISVNESVDDLFSFIKESEEEEDIEKEMKDSSEEVDEKDLPDDAEMDEGCESECEEEDTEEDEEDDLDDALDDLEDKSEDEIDRELSEIDTEVEDEPEEKLDDVDDKRADDMLAMVATPMLIKDELTAQEAVQFFESVEGDIAVSEGLIQESTLDDIYTEGVFASPNKPFKMTKKARLNQLYELSVQIEARAHRDPLMARLDRAYAIERSIKKELRKRYGTRAMKRAKGYLQRLMKSKSGVLKTLGNKLKK